MTKNINYLKGFYIPTLDGWRAISIALVLMFHGSWLYFGPESASYDPNTWNYLKLGAYGVKIFFVISGFLICRRIIEEIRRSGTFDLKSFYVRRFFRIFPPYYSFVFVLSVISFFTTGFIDSKNFFAALFFYQIYLKEWSWYIGHFSSLCVEEQFYILSSLAFYFIPSKKMPYVLGLSYFLVCGLIFAKFKLFEPEMKEQINYFLRPIFEMRYMAIGCLFAFLDFHRPKFIEKLKYLTIPAFILLPIFIICNFPGKDYLIAVFIGTSVYLTSCHPVKFTNFFLENRFVKYIGKLSYSIYLWQQLFFVSHKEIFIEPIEFLQVFPINIICIFIMANISYYFIEKPTIKFGHKFSSPPK